MYKVMKTTETECFFFLRGIIPKGELTTQCQVKSLGKIESLSVLNKGLMI